MSRREMEERYRYRQRQNSIATVKIKSQNVAATAQKVQQIEGLSSMEAASHVAVAITKMKRNFSTDTTQVGSSNLKLITKLLNKLKYSILPTLEDAAQVSITSAQRQLDTQPQRRINMGESKDDSHDDQSDNPYAAVLVPTVSQFMASPTKLCESTVIIVGVDGPGATLAMMLARRGLGRLILVDDGIVAENDWRNSTVFTPDMTGFPRAHAICSAILEINADTELEAACVDVRKQLGQTLLAHCMESGTLVVAPDFTENGGHDDGNGRSSLSSRDRLLSANRRSNDRIVEPMTIYRSRPASSSHDGPPRRLRRIISHVEKLKTRNYFDVPNDSEEQTKLQSNKKIPPLQTKSLIVCCKGNEHYLKVVSSAAMEFNMAAIFAKSVPRNGIDASKSRDDENGFVEFPSVISAPSSSSPPSSAKDRTGQMFFVVPGLTSCLSCRFQGGNQSRGNANMNTDPQMDTSALALSDQQKKEDGTLHSSLSTGTMFSAAAHTVVSSMICQTILSFFLSTPNDQKRFCSSVWYGNSDAVHSKKASPPDRNCKSSRCRSHQSARRRQIHKKKIRKVLKVSNMFSWTKKRNLANMLGGNRDVGSDSMEDMQAENSMDPEGNNSNLQGKKAQSSASMTMTELAAKASARRTARRRQ